MATATDQALLEQILRSYNFGVGNVPTSTNGQPPPGTGNQTITASNNQVWELMPGGDDFNRDLMGWASGGLSTVIDKLFGKKKQKVVWNPYLDAQGNYFWTSPATANPVPLSDIPGASLSPSTEYVTLANQIRAISDLLPYYSQAVSAQKIPDAAAQLAADYATTGPRLALQQALQEQYGPIFDQLAAESNLRRASYAAANDAAVLAGPGKDLVTQALETAKIYDPEYYNTRAVTADSMNKLLAQATANLDSGLSNTERDEVGRALALENSRRGTANAPSQLQTVANAMQFGAAGRAREAENQNQLSKAIVASTAFLPSAKSGVDVFQVATGKPSYPQQDNRFSTTGTTNDAADSAQGLLNTGASFWTTNANNTAAMQRQDAQLNHWTNQLGAISNAIGSIGSLASAL